MAETAFVIRCPAEMRKRAEVIRASGRRIGVVPTMGALHPGHLSLLDAARTRCDVLVLTIFVNPTQFGPGEDLGAYPRREAEDLRLAEEHGVNLAYCPDVSAMYGEGYQTFVEVGELSRGLCGDGRPGHFRGVATVVTKLFNATLPHVAVFGQKDYQQLAIIRRLNRDLDFGIDIVAGPIVRADDGLALSSRNRYLSADERTSATALSRGLRAAEAAFRAGTRHPRDLVAAAEAVVSREPGVALEYLELRDAETLEPLEAEISRAAVLAIAARVGPARLIDNILLGDDSHSPARGGGRGVGWQDDSHSPARGGGRDDSHDEQPREPGQPSEPK